MEAHLADPNLYKYFYTGHGRKADGGLDVSGGVVLPLNYTKYGIADMRLVACYTWTGASQWAGNVSVNGQLETWRGVITIYSGTRVVQPGSKR